MGKTNPIIVLLYIQTNQQEIQDCRPVEKMKQEYYLKKKEQISVEDSFALLCNHFSVVTVFC